MKVAFKINERPFTDVIPESLQFYFYEIECLLELINSEEDESLLSYYSYRLAAIERVLSEQNLLMVEFPNGLPTILGNDYNH